MDVFCEGPGPHFPASGKIGTADREVRGMRCSAESCQIGPDAAALARDSNTATIRQQVATALDGNRTFLALTSPTNAQTVAQVRALSRQMNGLIRLTLGQLDATD